MTTSSCVAVALSSRFPLGTARDYDLDVGTHADWFVLGLAVLAVLFGVLAVAAGAAWWRVTSAPRPTVARRSSTGRRTDEPRAGA